MDLIWEISNGCKDHSSWGVVENRVDSCMEGVVRVRGGSLRSGGSERGRVKGWGHCEWDGSEMYADSALLKSKMIGWERLDERKE
jgi:hypothetical protein